MSLKGALLINFLEQNSPTPPQPSLLATSVRPKPARRLQYGKSQSPHLEADPQLLISEKKPEDRSLHRLSVSINVGETNLMPDTPSVNLTKGERASLP